MTPDLDLEEFLAHTPTPRCITCEVSTPELLEAVKSYVRAKAEKRTSRSFASFLVFCQQKYGYQYKRLTLLNHVEQCVLKGGKIGDSVPE